MKCGDMPSLILNKHLTKQIIIHNSFACVCAFEALFIHQYMKKPSEFKVMVMTQYLLLLLPPQLHRYLMFTKQFQT